MPTHTKQSLDTVAQIASMAYLNSDTPLNESVVKLARQHDLSDEQVSTVCRLANHHVNANHMSKEAYTEFQVARPDEVLSALGQDKTAALAVYAAASFDEGLDKTASTEPFAEVVAGRFNEVARLYGHTITFTGDREQDGVRFVKAAEIVATRALESQVLSKSASEDALGAYYNSIRRSLLDGVPIGDLQSESERTKTADMLKRIWPRLEAEALVQTSIRDDAGPYSLERMYKTASTSGVTHAHVAAAVDHAFKGFNSKTADHMEVGERISALKGHLAKHSPYDHNELTQRIPDHVFEHGSVKDMHRALSTHFSASGSPSLSKQAEVDPGIQAMQDLLFGRFEIPDGAPLLKQAAAYRAARERYLVDTRAAQLCLAGIAHVDKLAQFDATPFVKAAAVSAARRLAAQARSLGKL